MKDIGNFLKERREARGVSLIEVEKDLKIRKKYLQAIEEGNIDIIPGKTYLIGYLRNYSKYLGIDEENINQIIQTYKNLEKSKSNLEETGENIILPKKQKRDKSIFEKKKFFFPIKYVYLTSFILIICIGLLFLSHSLKEAQNFPIPSPEIAKETDINIEKNINSETEAIIAEYPKEKDISNNTLPILKLIANDKSWIKILSGGKIIFEGILFTAEVFSWKTDQALEIITEYPTKIEAYYNDEIIEINKGVINNYILKYDFNPTQNISYFLSINNIKTVRNIL